MASCVSAAEGLAMHNPGLEKQLSENRPRAVVLKDYTHARSYFLLLAWLLFIGNFFWDHGI